ncbi:hypothetical protein [Acetobacter oeni]|nr:hypothetical protein [Acetobacter oeni]NHO17417.1 hypothetical protein [Acetobacter oeni]
MSLGQTSLLQKLDETLLAASSATRAMELWCEDLLLFPAPVRMTASVERNGPGRPPDQIRELLAVRPDEIVQYRRVSLSVHRHILSRAENWYVPARLPDTMNHVLTMTSEPFGRVVSPLTISRTTLESVRLQPRTGGDEILRHVAVLRRKDGIPISIVTEIYMTTLLQRHV